MALTDLERHAVSAAMSESEDPAIQGPLLNAGPQWPAVAIVVEYLTTAVNAETGAPLPAGEISKLAIAYSLAAGSNTSTTSWCTSAECPVRGQFISRDAGSPIDSAVLVALNTDPLLIDRLNITEVFPARLRAVRASWIAVASHIFPLAVGLDLDADAMDLRIGLHDFVGGSPRQDCKGSKCPGVSNVGCC